MTSEAFDAIVVGTGQAGPAIAARCSKEGLKTAVIERHRFGGTCVNVGCVPTKTLVATARAVRLAHRGADFGFDVDSISVDMARVMARKNAIVEKSSAGVESWMRGLKGAEVITGHARFVAPATLAVGDRQLTAPRIFLNVGARAVYPALTGIDQVKTLNNVSVLQLQEVPEHLVVVGGNYIGLEFAHLMRRLGSEVTVIERSPRLVMREDEDVSLEVQKILEAEGVRFRLGAECLSFAPSGQKILAGTECGSEADQIEGSHVLLAVGRRPNTDDLGLDRAGIRTDERGFITVDDQCATSALGVWAVGDCNGRGAFTHTSWNDHEIVVANLFDGDARRISDRVPCYALFIDPALARIGMTETEARQSGKRLLQAKMPMQKVGRAREAGETLGFMKVVVDAESKQLLGAALLGLNADEVIHGLLDIMTAKLPYTAISRTMHIHPTVSELVPTLLQQLRPIE